MESLQAHLKLVQHASAAAENFIALLQALEDFPHAHNPPNETLAARRLVQILGSGQAAAGDLGLASVGLAGPATTVGAQCT